MTWVLSMHLHSFHFIRICSHTCEIWDKYVMVHVNYPNKTETPWLSIRFNVSLCVICTNYLTKKDFFSFWKNKEKKKPHGRYVVCACRRFNGLHQRFLMYSESLWSKKDWKDFSSNMTTLILTAIKYINQMHSTQNSNRRLLHEHMIKTCAWLGLFLSHPFGIFIIYPVSRRLRRNGCTHISETTVAFNKMLLCDFWYEYLESVLLDFCLWTHLNWSNECRNLFDACRWWWWWLWKKCGPSVFCSYLKEF